MMRLHDMMKEKGVWVERDGISERNKNAMHFQELLLCDCDVRQQYLSKNAVKKEHFDGDVSVVAREQCSHRN
jgi:hypothetical protein